MQLLYPLKKLADEQEKNLEALFLKKLPSLPKEIASFIISILYYLLLISIILNILSLISLLPALLFSTLYLPFIPFLSYRKASIASWLSVVFLIFYIILTYKALPLIKDKKYKGWKLLYYMLLVSLLQFLVSLVYLSFSLTGILILGLSFYLLFQIKPYFKN